MTIDHAIPQSSRLSSLWTPDKTNPAGLSNSAVFPRISSISCLVPTPDARNPHVNGGRASHLFSATSRLYLPCLLTRARSSYSNRLSPLTVSSFCLFRAIGVKLRRLRVRPRLKALTGTPLDAGAVGDGIHFRFRTCGNPVTRDTGENDRIESAARLRSYPHDSRDYDWWFAYEYFWFTLEMRR